MGCDIHMYAEKKIGDTWYPFTPPEHNKWYEPGDEKEGGPASRPLALNHDDVIWEDRNYRVFSMLAGVRNGIGFASVKTGEPITPISKPRGVPEDVSAEVKTEIDEWGCDGHSHSWLTLKELEAVPWDHRLIRQCGHVDARQFQTYEKDGEPDSWGQPLSFRGLQVVTNDEMRELIAAHGIEVPEDSWHDSKINGVAYLTEVAWSHTWAEVARGLLASMANLKIAGAAEGFEPDQLRYIFFFDN
jgi:hypothetical protein